MPCHFEVRFSTLDSFLSRHVLIWTSGASLAERAIPTDDCLPIFLEMQMKISQLPIACLVYCSSYTTLTCHLLIPVSNAFKVSSLTDKW